MCRDKQTQCTAESCCQPCEPSQPCCPLHSVPLGGRAGSVPAVSPGRVLSSAVCPQGPGWSCTSAMAVAVAARRPRAARSRCQPRCPSTTGTWRRSCWTPSTSRAGAAPGRAPTVTGEQGLCQGHHGVPGVSQRQECCMAVLHACACLCEHTCAQGCVCLLRVHMNTCVPGKQSRCQGLTREPSPGPGAQAVPSMHVLHFAGL